MRSTIYLKISIIILAAFLLLWGLFYFTKNSQKNLVSENIYEENVEIVEKDEVETIINEEGVNEDKKSENKEVFPEKEIETPVIIIEEEAIEEKVSNNKIKDNLVSWGFTASSGRKIDTVVLHSSYNALGGDEYDLDKLIAVYKEYGVAAHYLIDRKGDIYRLVKDEDIAYHAGVSEVPDGRTGVNSFSIGIEIMNTKTDDYEKEQYEATNWLIKEIKKDYNVKYILGHSEIAPERKTDPWNIKWDKIDR